MTTANNVVAPPPPVPPAPPPLVPPPPKDTAAAVAHWVDVLRDGIYSQGTHYLMQDGIAWDDDCDEGWHTTLHCCLGVACELSELGAWQWLTEGENAVYAYVVGASEPGKIENRATDTPGHLPELVRQQLGLRTSLGEFHVTSEWLHQLRDFDYSVASQLEYFLEHFTDYQLPHTEPLVITLAAINDDTDIDFDGIATIIESQPPMLFAS